MSLLKLPSASPCCVACRAEILALSTSLQCPRGSHLAAAFDAHGDDGHGTAQGELDELEREEFFRLKKVQNKKKRDDGARAKAATDKVTLPCPDPPPATGQQ